MGNVIPWSQIHPSIKSEEPFVAVVIVDPQRQICVSEMVQFELDALVNADLAAPELIAAAQAAAAKVASGYRARRKATASAAFPTTVREIVKAPTLTLPRERGRENRTGLRVLNGGKR